MTGVVTSFSDSVGLGTVTSADGSEFSFHCIEIAERFAHDHRRYACDLQVVAALGHLAGGRHSSGMIYACPRP